jgi:hypothetical protein
VEFSWAFWGTTPIESHCLARPVSIHHRAGLCGSVGLCPQVWPAGPSLLGKLGNTARHRREVADIAVDDPEQPYDRGLVRRDAIEAMRFAGLTLLKVR